MKYVIGDIHGNLPRLHMLIESLEENGPITKLIFLGDYIDRGLESCQTIEYLIQLSKKYDCTFLRGNHDDIFCHLLGLPDYTNYEHFMSAKTATPNVIAAWFIIDHGMGATVESYGLLDDHTVQEIIDDPSLIATKVPDSHKEFFKNTTLAYEDDDVLCFHGFPGEDDHQKLWYKFATLAQAKSTISEKRICLGHTPVQHYSKNEPQIANKVILLDGLSWLPEGFLSAYGVESGAFTIIS